MSGRESVSVEALGVMSMSPPNWWVHVSLGNQVIFTNGWHDSYESALKAGREWAQAKGLEVLPIRAEEEADDA